MLIYLLQVTLSWALFALLYSLLLRRETFFRANRFYLLGAVLAGIMLPLSDQLLPALGAAAGGIPVRLPALTLAIQQAEQHTRAWTGLSYLGWLYGAGFVLAVTRLLWGMARLCSLVRQSPAGRLNDGCVLLRTPAAVVPFSFFRWIFVPTDFDQQPDYQKMLTHELAHARAWHSADVLMLEVLCVIFWFHPLAHWYRRALRTVHEYQADAAASAQTDRKQYGLLLLQQRQPQLAWAFANHFFQSPLKQRLLMLTKKSSPLIRTWKFGLALPVALVVWGMSQQQISGNRDAAAATKLPGQHTLAAQFPGGMPALSAFLGKKIRYPEAARREKAEGRVTLKIVLDETGAITDVEALAPFPRQDLADEAIRVVRQMPKWKPARFQGRPVPTKMQLPIQFKLN